MSRSETLSILTTFVFGFFAGVYFYVNGFVLKFDAPQIPTRAEAEELVIVGEVYGGCQLGANCPSFQVGSDGAYRYLYTPAINSEQVIRDGRLPTLLQRELKSTLQKTALVQQSKKIQPSICNSYTDGLDIKYTITLQGETFVLDSCQTNVDGDGQLWQSLAKIWKYFETGEV